MILLKLVSKLSCHISEITIGGYLGFLAIAELALIFERGIGAKSFSNCARYMNRQ